MNNMATYRWKEGSRLTRLDAQAVGEELTTISGEDERLTPEAVVAKASKKRSVLHPAFEWDDNAAAHEYRKDQARDLIRSVCVVVQVSGGAERKTRAFVHIIQGNGTKEGAYVTIQKAAAEPDLVEQVLDRALYDLGLWQERYRELEELLPLMATIDEFKEVTVD